MLDYRASKLEVIRIERIHTNIVSFLREIDSDFHEIPARNLALRVENHILQPVRYALSVIEKIEDLGQNAIPDEILKNWNIAIYRALKFGGMEFEF